MLERGCGDALFAGSGRRAGAGRVAAQAAGGGSDRLCRDIAGEVEGRFSVVLDGAILEAPLVGEGSGPEGRLGGDSE